jgi:hypothetical protein
MVPNIFQFMTTLRLGMNMDYRVKLGPKDKVTLMITLLFRVRKLKGLMLKARKLNFQMQI